MWAATWHSKRGIPLVFLHGLLGSQQDWAGVLALLQNSPQIRPLTLDLPYHAKSHHLGCSSLDEACEQLHTTLTELLDEPFWLVGYSLGGRIALHYTQNYPQKNLLGTILEGTNLGLATNEERDLRWQNDLNWAARFQAEPIEVVLNDWYQQAVFSDLSFVERQTLIQKRQAQSGEMIAQMLKATSLAKQPNYAKQLSPKLHFIVGERDNKFRQQANAYGLMHHLIAQAGHNTHHANPAAFVKTLKQIIFSQ